MLSPFQFPILKISFKINCRMHHGRFTAKFPFKKKKGLGGLWRLGMEYATWPLYDVSDKHHAPNFGVILQLVFQKDA